MDLLGYITGRVEHYEQHFGLKRRGQAFMIWYAVEALGLDEDDAFVAVDFDGGNDKGIDLFYIDDENERIVIAQGKFHGRGKYNPRPGELHELTSSIRSLQSPETLKRDGRPDLADAAEDYMANIDRGYTVDFHFVYMGPWKKEVTDAATQYNNDPDTPSGRFGRVVDLELLRQIHDEHIGAAARIAEATIRLDPDAAFAQKGAYGRSLVATVPGMELKRLHDEHRQALFDRNVRLFLGARKGSVNAGIRDTLNSSEERQNFWAYNNGITVVCDNFDYDATNGLLIIKKFSIVNGCQTTVSIASSSELAAEDIGVLARFIAAPETQVVDSIIKFNNSQTKIRDWDLSSQDKSQKRLAKLLAEDPHPFFYELRRGEWNHLSTDDKQKFTRSGKQQVMTPDVLAQRLAAFKKMAVPAYKNKGELFTTHGRKVFPQDLRVEEVLLAWHSGEAAESAVAIAVSEAKDEGQREQVRILTRGGKTFIVSVMAILLEERNGAEYLSRIKRVVAGSQNTRKDLAIYAEVALTYYVEIMEDLIESDGESGLDLNVMVRSEDSFAKVQRRVRNKWKRDKNRAAFVEALPKLV